jgi:hypothetical protein
MRRSVLAALIAVISLSLSAPLSATTMVFLTEDDLVDRARTIVHGDVVSKRCALAPEGGRIYTEYVFRAREVLKGTAAPDGTVVFREWGGEVNGVRYAIPGVGEFAQGEEVVAFLGAPDPRTGVGFTTGLSLGKFRVVRDRAGAARVRRTVAGMTLLDRSSGNELPPPTGEERDLSAFKTAIRARLAR